MPEYLSPGVYVEEVASGIKPIEGVGTSTGAFIGIAERGQINKPVLVTNFTQFTATFGGFIENGYLAYAVFQFFQEGGTRCYVVRAAKGDAQHPLKAAETAAAETAIKDETAAETAIKDLTVRASSEGEWGNQIKIMIEKETAATPGAQPRPAYFKLTVLYKEQRVDMFDNLTMEDIKERHVAKHVISKWISVEDKGDKRPDDGTYPLVHGANGVKLSSPDWAGAEGFIHAFDTVDDINIIAIPDALGDQVVIKEAYGYCENRNDCFFVADTTTGLDATSVRNFRNNSGFNSKFSALYWPWIRVSDPLTGGTKLVPPSGAVVGTYSHTDGVRGVHKAPAGIDEGSLNSAVGIERSVTEGEHDTLNPNGVNVIRSFPGAGIVIWGARTLSVDPEWRYINIRRLVLFIEESIEEGTQWVVFEPNSPILWGRVKRNITAFLTRVWRDGALFGTTAEEAFFVKVDAENNPPDVIEAGQLIIEVGIAPVRPAEFVIIRISQKTLGKAA